MTSHEKEEFFVYTFFMLIQKEWLTGPLPTLLLGKNHLLIYLDISNHSLFTYQNLTSLKDAELNIDISQIIHISTKTKLKKSEVYEKTNAKIISQVASNIICKITSMNQYNLNSEIG